LPIKEESRQNLPIITSTQYGYKNIFIPESNDVDISQELLRKHDKEHRCTSMDGVDECEGSDHLDAISTSNMSLFSSKPLIYLTFRDNTLTLPHLILSALTE
jgi:hypothetical protein